MQSLFQQIKGVKYTQPQLKQNKPSRNTQFDIVLNWKKDPNSENTSKLIEYIKPTIDSALHTYTPGQQKDFRIKATKLALQAVKNFDPKYKASPRTLIFTNLQRLNRLRRQRENIIHIPESTVYLKTLVDKKKNQLEDSLGRQPSLQELCDSTGLSAKKIQKIYSQGATVNDSATVNDQTGQSSFKLGGMSSDDYYKYIYNMASPVDKKIMQWSSGIGSAQLSNNDIAKRLRISPGAVSQRKLKIQQQLGQIRGLL